MTVAWSKINLLKHEIGFGPFAGNKTSVTLMALLSAIGGINNMFKQLIL